MDIKCKKGAVKMKYRKRGSYYGLKVEEGVGDDRIPTHKEQREEIEDMKNRSSSGDRNSGNGRGSGGSRTSFTPSQGQISRWNRD